MNEFLELVGAILGVLLLVVLGGVLFGYVANNEMVNIQDALKGKEISLSDTLQITCKPTKSTASYLKLTEDLKILSKLREDSNE